MDISVGEVTEIRALNMPRVDRNNDVLLRICRSMLASSASFDLKEKKKKKKWFSIERKSCSLKERIDDEEIIVVWIIYIYTIDFGRFVIKLIEMWFEIVKFGRMCTNIVAMNRNLWLFDFRRWSWHSGRMIALIKSLFQQGCKKIVVLLLQRFVFLKIS